MENCGGNTMDIFSFVEEGKLSALVYLSIMYAGIPHVDAACLGLSGFDSSATLAESIRKDYKVGSPPVHSFPYSLAPAVAPGWAFRPLGFVGVFLVAHEFMEP